MMVIFTIYVPHRSYEKIRDHGEVQGDVSISDFTEVWVTFCNTLPLSRSKGQPKDRYLNTGHRKEVVQSLSRFPSEMRCN